MERTRIVTDVETHLTQLPADAVISIIAGAGTGKTHNLTKRYIALLEHTPELRPEHIVVLTFTDKAATEMRARIVHAVTHDTRLSSRFSRLDMAAARISTFHVFAAELALRHSIAINLSPTQPFADQDETAIRHEHAWESFLTDAGLAYLAQQDADYQTLDWAKKDLFSELRYIINDARGRAEDVATFTEHLGTSSDSKETVYRATLAWLYSRYAEGLVDDGKLDLDDLIRVAPQILRTEPDERANIRVVMFDEFQDTSPPQDTLMRAMTPHSNGRDHARFVVGDPRQSIYLWRNAQPDNLRVVDAETPAGQQFSLLHNYRSREPILTIANHILTYYDHPADHAQRAFDPEEILLPARSDQRITAETPADTVRVSTFADTHTEAAAIVAQIAALREQGIPYGGMAILVRKRTAALPVIAALDRLALPYDDGALVPFYQKPLVLDAIHTLIAADNPYNDLSLTRAVWQACRVWDEKHFADARAANKNIALWDLLRTATDDMKVSSFVAALENANQTRRYLPPMLWAQQVLHATGLWDRDGAYGIRVLHRLLVTLCRDVTSVYGLIEAIRHAPNSDTKADAPELRSDSDTVRIMTVHAAKGLEFPAVFVIDAKDYHYKDPITTPSYKSGQLRFDKNDAAHATYITQTKNEVVTTFYVAVTRAKDWLWISSSLINKSEERVFFKLSAHYSDTSAPGIMIVSADETQLTNPVSSTQTQTGVFTEPTRYAAIRAKPLVTLTPTALADLTSCPRKYRFTRRSGLNGLAPTATADTQVLPVPPSLAGFNTGDAPTSAEPVTIDTPDDDASTSADARLLGSLFHRVCELHCSTPTLTSSELVSAAATRSASPVGAADLRLLSELTDRYLASPFAHPPAPVATERTLTWEWDRPAARVRFTGVVDRSDGATIIDYKTDSELSGLAERHGTQLRLYGLALADADPQRMPRLQLYHARTGTVVDVDASPSAVAATYAELDRALEWLARDAFPATPSFSACQYCPARAYCPEAFPVGSARV